MLKKEFTVRAKPLDVNIDSGGGEGSNVRLYIPTKVFSTGSIGWYNQTKGKVVLPDGREVECTFQTTVTIIKSKELNSTDQVGTLPGGEPEAPEAPEVGEAEAA